MAKKSLLGILATLVLAACGTTTPQVEQTPTPAPTHTVMQDGRPYRLTSEQVSKLSADQAGYISADGMLLNPTSKRWYVLRTEHTAPYPLALQSVLIRFDGREFIIDITAACTAMKQRELNPAKAWRPAYDGDPALLAVVAEGESCANAMIASAQK